MKQTAVEWLEDYLVNAEQIDFWGAVEQAKKIKKRHLYNFYMQGGVDAIMEANRNVEQYYNETFKSE